MAKEKNPKEKPDAKGKNTQVQGDKAVKRDTPRKIIPKGTKFTSAGTGAKGGDTIKAGRDPEQIKKVVVILVSLSLCLGLLGMAGYMFFTKDVETQKSTTYIIYSWDKPVDDTFNITNKIEVTYVTFIMLAIMAFSGPVGLLYMFANRKIDNMEDRLGDFLRDISESARSGQTLHQSIRTASAGDYGALTPEIKAMAQQISWGVAATDALERFSNRVNTPLVRRAVTLIIEASKAGGEVSKVLDAAATDTREIQLLRKERAMEMGMYVMVIFISFVVFLIVILIVYNTFVPQMKKLGDSFRKSGTGGSMAGGMDPSKVDFDEVKLIYTLSGGVNGLGCGLVAGLMSTGKITDGLKYTFIMVAIDVILFTFIMTG